MSFYCLNNQIRHTLHSLQSDFLFFCCSQVFEIVALLTEEYDLLDWRRFLLCAALPWPVPSLSQLLVVLQRFRSIDAEHTGYIKETEYNKVSIYTLNGSEVKSIVLHIRISIKLAYIAPFVTRQSCGFPVRVPSLSQRTPLSLSLMTA